MSSSEFFLSGLVNQVIQNDQFHLLRNDSNFFLLVSSDGLLEITVPVERFQPIEQVPALSA